MKHTAKVSHRLVIDGELLLRLVREDMARKAGETEYVDAIRDPTPPATPETVRFSGLRFVRERERPERSIEFDALEISWED